MNRQIVFSIVSLVQLGFSLEDPVVVLPNGQILGREASTAEDSSYYAFEGIPYAAPPIGNLRFKVPQPVADWDGTLNATHSDVACYQFRIHKNSESEDCLYLNVYTPRVLSDEAVPVMVYIHGGAFIMGQGTEYQPDLFIDNGVILVTINYRLGVFGFLTTQDEVVPGNNGLKDQLQALQWIHNNIHLFGGDPQQVTIFGQSAGASSCGYHLLNQQEKGLFSGAILESGTSLGQLRIHKRGAAFGTAALLNSTFETNDDSETVYQFLLNADADELNAAAEEYSESVSTEWNGIAGQGGMFSPVFESENSGAIITERIYGLFKSGQVLPVTTMMGFTSEESVLGNSDDPDGLKSILEILDEHLEYLVPNDMMVTDPESRTRMGEQIREIYTGGEPLSDHLGSGLRYSTDNTCTRPMIKHAEFALSVATIYFYQFSYDGSIGGHDVPDFGDGAGTVGHMEELNYLFCSGADCNGDGYPEADLLTRQRLIKLWTNFAKYRNPTPEVSELLQNITWPELAAGGDFIYLDINGELTIQKNPRNETYKKWDELYGSLGYDDFYTY